MEIQIAGFFIEATYHSGESEPAIVVRAEGLSCLSFLHLLVVEVNWKSISNLISRVNTI